MIRLKVNGKWYENFSTVNVDLKLNTIASTFSFTGFKDFFKILKYDDCEVYFNDELLITGTILNPVVKYAKAPVLIGVSGYSKTGILEDVSMPIALYPLQYDGLSLKQIAKKITDHFGLRLKVFENAETSANLAFEKVSASVGDSPKAFLSSLCNQRGIVLAHDNYGRLLLYKVKALVKPKLNLKFDDALNVDFAPNAQAIHSSVTVLRQAKKDNNNAQQITVDSPFVSGDLRPLVTAIQDGEELAEMANKLVCAEARNFPLKMLFEGFLEVRSGFYITLEGGILKQRTKFLIESVVFSYTKSKTTTLLNLVLPCVYTGVVPSGIPFI